MQGDRRVSRFGPASYRRRLTGRHILRCSPHVPRGNPLRRSDFNSPWALGARWTTSLSGAMTKAALPDDAADDRTNHAYPMLAGVLAQACGPTGVVRVSTAREWRLVGFLPPREGRGRVRRHRAARHQRTCDWHSRARVGAHPGTGIALIQGVWYRSIRPARAPYEAGATRPSRHVERALGYLHCLLVKVGSDVQARICAVGRDVVVGFWME